MRIENTGFPATWQIAGSSPAVRRRTAMSNRTPARFRGAKTLNCKPAVGKGTSEQTVPDCGVMTTENFGHKQDQGSVNAEKAVQQIMGSNSVG